MKEILEKLKKGTDKILLGFYNNFWQLIIFSLVVSTIFSVGINVYNKNEITDLMRNMYYIEFVESKDKEMVLEVMTNSFITVEDDDTLESAILHLKNGTILSVEVAKDKNVFVIKSDSPDNISKRLYKYNSTSKVQEMKEKKNQSKDKKQSLVIDNNTNENEKEKSNKIENNADVDA